MDKRSAKSGEMVSGSRW